MMSSTPMRVVHVFGKMDRGGAETLVMNVYRTIDRSAMQFDFLVHSMEPGQYDREIEELGGRIFRVGAPKLVTCARYLRTLVRTFREQGPFIAVHSHVHFFSGLIMAAAACCNIERRISHSHTARIPHNNSIWGGLYRAICRTAILRFSTNLLGCSRETCTVLFGDRCFRDSRVEILHNGILTSAFGENSAQQPFNELCIEEDDVLVCHVGNFTPPKNHSFVLRVFSVFLMHEPSAHLLLVGGGALQSEIERLAARLGVSSRVHFLGSRSDVPSLLSQCHVMLFPSLWEGIPLSLVEAQASGLPCVVSESISPEVDLGLGLLNWVSLNAPLDEWAESLRRTLAREKLEWSTRRAAICNAGYDVETATSKLNSLYGGRGY